MEFEINGVSIDTSQCYDVDLHMAGFSPILTFWISAPMRRTLGSINIRELLYRRDGYDLLQALLPLLSEEERVEIGEYIHERNSLIIEDLHFLLHTGRQWEEYLERAYSDERVRGCMQRDVGGMVVSLFWHVGCRLTGCGEVEPPEDNLSSMEEHLQNVCRTLGISPRGGRDGIEIDGDVSTTDDRIYEGLQFLKSKFAIPNQ